MSGLRRVRASVALKNKSNVPHVLVRSKAVYAGFSKHTALLPNPTIAMTILAAQIEDLETAQLAITTTKTGTAAQRLAPLYTLCSSLYALCAYAQLTADASPEKAVEIIEAAGMKVATPTVQAKPLLDARLDSQGAVLLRAHAKMLHKGTTNRCFNWQYTLDGGKTWINAPSTAIAQTSISGLPAMTMCGFRVSATHKKGQSEWSPMVSVVVP